jgi:hypothetical protein
MPVPINDIRFKFQISNSRNMKLETRHCERSEAIHAATRKVREDCFASLAMTSKYESAFPRRDAPGFCDQLPPSKTEGAVLPQEGSRECRTLGASAAARVE